MSTLFALNEVRNWPHYFEKVLVRSFPSKDFFVDGEVGLEEKSKSTSKAKKAKPQPIWQKGSTSIASLFLPYNWIVFMPPHFKKKMFQDQKE